MKPGKFIRVKHAPLAALLRVVLEKGDVEMVGLAKTVNHSGVYDIECYQLEQQQTTLYHRILDE